jgi:hypothetical protein
MLHVLCPRHPLHRTQSRRPAFGATIRRHLFLEVAECCRSRLSKPISLLAVARCFCVLRSEWCQQWCQMASTAPRIPMSLGAPGACSVAPLY